MTALCVQACRQRKKARFVSAASLINELVEAQRNGQLSRALNRWRQWDLLAIDEMGYVPFEETGAELLFQVITERAEKAAILITTNRLCGAPHKRFNAESILMRTPRSMEKPHRHSVIFLLRILGAAFNISISLSVALKRPDRSFGAITDSRASSFTDGSARV
jgi:hypothetical protein